MIKGRLQLFQEQLFFELDEKPITQFVGVQEWRSVWKSFGGNPSRYRPSNEALLRRIKKQQYVSPVNSAVDLNNFFSLQYDIPIGIYDCTSIDNAITLQIGNETTAYKGLNGSLNRLKNILTLIYAKCLLISNYLTYNRNYFTDLATDTN